MALENCLAELKELGLTSVRNLRSTSAKEAKTERYRGVMSGTNQFCLINQLYSKLTIPPNEVRTSQKKVYVWFESGINSLGIEIFT